MAREIDAVDAHTAVGEPALGSDDGEQLVLSDLINRVLDKGVVISGHVTISVADIDLIALDLRLLVSSIQTAMARRGDADAAPSP
ncbi:MAG: gas vesicle protein [Gemmatimonadota bacterium]|nr:gas vesicle protein [Gemmatimonadota bacterium]